MSSLGFYVFYAFTPIISENDSLRRSISYFPFFYCSTEDRKQLTQEWSCNELINNIVRLVNATSSGNINIFYHGCEVSSSSLHSSHGVFALSLWNKQKYAVNIKGSPEPSRTLMFRSYLASSLQSTASHSGRKISIYEMGNLYFTSTHKEVIMRLLARKCIDILTGISATIL